MKEKLFKQKKSDGIALFLNTKNLLFSKVIVQSFQQMAYSWQKIAWRRFESEREMLGVYFRARKGVRKKEWEKQRARGKKSLNSSIKYRQNEKVV